MSDPVSSGSSAWVLSTPDGFRWRRSQGNVFAEWIGILTLRVDAEGRVFHEAAPGADPRLVEKVTHTGARAFVRALHDQPSLHGSAVTRAGSALVCLGEKGAGKSTAASELCRSIGFELLADDVAALDHSGGRWCVLPTESSHWLAGDGGDRKGPVAASSASSHPADLSSLVVLRLEDGVPSLRARRLRGAEAYSALSAALLRFEAADALRVRELGVLSSVAAQARVYELVRGRSSAVHETAAVLMQLMEGAP
jgi:hypothetical protein